MGFRDELFSGKYKTRRQIEEEKEIKRQEVGQKANNMNTVKQLNKEVMRQEGAQIKAQSEARKQYNDYTAQIQANKKQLKQAQNQQKINNFATKSEERKNTLTKIGNQTDRILLPINKNKTTTNNIANNPLEFIQKAIPMAGKQIVLETVKDTPKILENAGLGAVQGFQNIPYYYEQLGKFGARKVGSYALNKLLNNKEVADSTSQVLTDAITNNNKDLNKFHNERNRINENISKNIEDTSNPLTKKLTELAPSIGSNATMGLVSAVNPFAGSMMFVTSAGGSYFDEGKKRGMNDDQALGYATVMGGIEGGTESLITGGMASRILNKTTGKVLSEKFLQSSLNELIENFAQEFATEHLNEATAQVFGGKANWENIWGRSLESGIDGVLSALILQGSYAGISSSQNILNKLNNGQQVSETEIDNMLNDLKKNDKTGYEQTVQGAVEAIKSQMQDLQQNQAINGQNTQTRQITNQENKVSENRLSEQIKIDSENFAKQVDAVKNGTFPQKDMLVLGKTPQVLKDIGLQDLPITMTQKHLDTIMNESGKYEGANYHGLGEDIVKQLPKAINNPLDILKSNTRDDSIVLTTYLADKQNRPVIASIKIDGKGRVNDVIIDTNVMTSAYGRNNYDQFMQEAIKNGRLLYDIDRGVIKKTTEARLQLPRVGSSSTNKGTSINNIVPFSQENVNTTNKSMQNEQNNTQNSETNFEKYNRYKKNILDRRAKEVNNLISFKNDSIRNIDTKIAEIEAKIEGKKDKNTKIVATMRNQIENLKTRKAKIENLYNEKIDRVNNRVNKEKINYETRNTIRQEARAILRDEISPLTKDLTQFKDKKTGLQYNRETAQRNIEDIVKDKDLANAINETLFNPIQKHQAEKTREINHLFKKINELNLDKTKKYEYHPSEDTITGKITESKRTIKIDEATLAQLIIEKKLTDADLKNTYHLSNEQISKIHKTADLFTNILDYLYEQMNEQQIQYGYSPIGKRNNYFPHFFENKPDTMLGKIASYFGIDVTKQDLPTEIAGRTDIFKPGKTYNSNTLERKTNKTDYDALKAIEKYIVGATDIIYTTEDIQKLREFERQIRYQYSDKGIQENIDNILNDSTLTQDAKDSAIEGIFNNTEHELSNFVTWLNDYTNTLANKKAFADRNMEHQIGRNLYSSMSGIEGRIASNTIGGNLSVSMTNFAPIFQAMGTTKLNYIMTGMLQTASNDIKGFVGNKDTSFVNNSTFLTNRFGTDTIAQRKLTQKISDFASIPMNAIDEFTSESIVRAKYLENLDKGMTEEQALDSADKYTARIMADRSKGALPVEFNSKNPLSKLATMFQVEPNNIISNYFKDMPRQARSKAQLTAQYTKLMVASYAFNTLIMGIRGGNEVLPDPIRWVSYLIKAIFGDDDKEKEQAKKDLSESVIGSIPFASNVAGMLGMEDIGRIPISNALPNLSNVTKVFDSEKDSEYRKELAIKEISKPLLYLGLPTGGAQVKKTLEGITTINKGGSYKINSKGEKELQFPVENPTAKDYIKAGIFGKYSLPLAKEYQNRNFKSLTAKQTKTYEETKLPFKEYLEYIDAKLKTNEAKIKYLEEQKWDENQKWNIYLNDILSSVERKDGSSQVSDAKYITSHGVSKFKFITIFNKAFKNNITMPTEEEYKELQKQGISLEKYINDKIDKKNKK